MNTIRVQRKLEHLKIARKALANNGRSQLEDIALLPRCLGKYAISDIDLGTRVAGKHLEVPIIINAMTGGCAEAAPINRRLAKLAAAAHLGMAVGSQQAGLQNLQLKSSYSVAREANPEGLIWANLSASATVDEVARAVEMIAADGIQLHLNQAQELAMPEGERNFTSLRSNLNQLVRAVKVPIIAKEVGNGIAREDAITLQNQGINIVDVGGYGGTNFINIENQRGGLLGVDLESWGLPTAVSLLECLSVPGLSVIASGGIRSALDVARCLALGADAVGMALPFLHLTSRSDEDMLAATERFIYQLKCVFLLCGARNIKELQEQPPVILGATREWVEARRLNWKV